MLGSSSTPQSGGDQARAAHAAENTGNDVINTSGKLEEIKQRVTTALGMQKLFSQWVDRLWMS